MDIGTVEITGDLGALDVTPFDLGGLIIPVNGVAPTEVLIDRDGNVLIGRDGNILTF